MNQVGQPERQTQRRVIQQFQDVLGYDYLGDWHERSNSNIEEVYLYKFLRDKQGSSEPLIKNALSKLKRAAGDQSRSPCDVNKEVYNMLRYGVKVQPEFGEKTQTVWLIDWQNPARNHFAIAEEVTVAGENVKRPDIVLYVNGIALGVLELKRSTVSVSEGIRQNLDNQTSRFIRSFFSTIQLIMAGNDTQGIRYGVIQTPEKYYLSWKEEGSQENVLDRHIIQICAKDRFLELLHDFIVFDNGIKKICRPNQYFGVKAAQPFVRNCEGGIIWHSQGSGKSLTMVWLAKWIRENIRDPRVLIITDRTELDEQIENVFRGVNEDIYRTKSGADLIAQLNDSSPWLLCSLIHKFGNKDSEDEEANVSGFIEELSRSLPPGFSAKGNIYVFVDECHRTQSGELHEAMEKILPNAVFIGFTGTPLLKKDKKTSLEVFGRYIHTYRYDEAVADGVVLDLRYEARDIDQIITSQDKIDKWFEVKTRGLNDIARAQLKKRWGTIQKVLSSQSRLERIVEDIIFDMEMKDRLMSGRGNAMLVSSSIFQACKLYELFVKNSFNRCAIVTSYKPSPADIKGEETGDGLTERLRQYEIYRKMLSDWFNEPEDVTVNKVEEFEKAVKKKFVEEPGQMKLLIVVDKLLTGFDAPPATFLYIDKQMRDHGLFQAICRVNRLDGDDKEYGYIIDYKDLFKSLEESVHDYTSGAFDGYEKKDVDGLLTNRLTMAKKQMDATRETIKALCEQVETPLDSAAYLRHFCTSGNSDNETLKKNEPKRLALYNATAALLRSYANIAGEMTEAGYSTIEADKIRWEVEHYEKVRNEVKLASGDYIDLKMYEPAMRHLIDTYIRAEESEVLSSFDEMTLIQLLVERGPIAVELLPKDIRESKEAVAETIECNVRRLIIDESPINPKYYEKMSELLDALIKERRSKALDYKEYLEKIVELTKKASNPASGSSYPKSIDTAAKRALFDNLGKDEELATSLDVAIRSTKQNDWQTNHFKTRMIWLAINKELKDDERANDILEIVKRQKEYN